MGDGTRRGWPRSSKSSRGARPTRRVAPGAAALRARARSQRRAQDPHHPRLLREAVAALSARSAGDAAFFRARRARAGKLRRAAFDATLARAAEDGDGPLGKALANVMAFTTGEYHPPSDRCGDRQARRACQDGRISRRPRRLGGGRRLALKRLFRVGEEEEETLLAKLAGSLGDAAIDDAIAASRRSVRRPRRTRRPKPVFAQARASVGESRAAALTAISSPRTESREARFAPRTSPGRSRDRGAAGGAQANSPRSTTSSRISAWRKQAPRCSRSPTPCGPSTSGGSSWRSRSTTTT